jgi:hypothetical protein
MKTNPANSSSVKIGDRASYWQASTDSATLDASKPYGARVTYVHSTTGPSGGVLVNLVIDEHQGGSDQRNDVELFEADGDEAHGAAGEFATLRSPA